MSSIGAGRLGLELGLGSLLENTIKAEKSKPSIAVGFPTRVYAITAHTTYYIFSRISGSTYI